MGVYIPDMKMPTCCAGCIVLCDAKSRSGYVRPFGERLPDCPLISVPPHGRLIDADKLEWNYIRIRDDGIKEYTQRAINNAPTIIEAEEGET